MRNRTSIGYWLCTLFMGLAAAQMACTVESGGAPQAEEPVVEAKCVGAEDCAYLNPSDCELATCDPTTGCQLVAKEDGSACSTAELCVVAQTCQRGLCGGGVAAQPTCGGKQCGVDPCGNSCGSCGSDELCDNQGQCVPGEQACGNLSYEGCCTSNGLLQYCEDGKLKQLACAEGATASKCGWNGDQSFYDCGAAELPSSSPSQPYLCEGFDCPNACKNRECGFECGKDCGSCGPYETCSAGGTCVCVPLVGQMMTQCFNNDVYTYDSCGTRGDLVADCGSCGCTNGSCVTPKTCESQGLECGVHEDGCGTSIACGVCASDSVCNPSGKCETTVVLPTLRPWSGATAKLRFIELAEAKTIVLPNKTLATAKNAKICIFGSDGNSLPYLVLNAEFFDGTPNAWKTTTHYVSAAYDKVPAGIALAVHYQYGTFGTSVDPVDCDVSKAKPIKVGSQTSLMTSASYSLVHAGSLKDKVANNERCGLPLNSQDVQCLYYPKEWGQVPACQHRVRHFPPAN